MSPEEEFEAAVLPLIPGAAVVGGSAVSGGGQYGAVLLIYSNGHAEEFLFTREGDEWVEGIGFSGGGSAGLSWSPLPDSNAGVLRYATQAPTETTVAVVAYGKEEYVVPVRDGWVYLVVWDTVCNAELWEPPVDGPRVLRFE
jgi:hypothetical protein